MYHLIYFPNLNKLWSSTKPGLWNLSHPNIAFEALRPPVPLYIFKRCKIYFAIIPCKPGFFSSGILFVLDELPFARTDDGRVRCLRCEKCFTALANARRHFKEKHALLNDEIFQCHLCPVQFRVQRYYHEHLTRKHEISLKMFKNAFKWKCDNMFVSASHWRNKWLKFLMWLMI